MIPLVVLVYGCATKPKYQEELQNIEDTYRLHCDKFNVPLYVFVEEHATMSGMNYIKLPGVNDTYESNIPKTYLGLKWLMDHVKFEAVLVIGTDAYPNIPKLLQYLKTLDMSQPLYIGGHGDVHSMYGMQVYFHSGGPGFVLTRPLVSSIYPFLSFFPANWECLCMNTTYYGLRAAGDVLLPFYLLQTGVTHQVVHTPSLSFSHCTHRGYPCHVGTQTPEGVMCCHLMKRQEMLEYTYLLETNNFYL